jgi:WD40 repeat protein
VNGVAVSPDGRWVASAEKDRYRLVSWPGSRPVILAALSRTAGVFRDWVAPAFSSDSRRVAGAEYNGKASRIAVWTVPGSPDGDLPRWLGRDMQFRVPGSVSALDFSQDGKQLLAAMSDGSVRVWRLSGGGVTVLRGHRGFVADAAFSADGREIVSGGSADGMLRLWELGEGGKAVAFPARVGRIGAVGFSADGSIVASGTTDAREWACDFCGPIDDVLDRAKAMTVRSLTADERALYLHEG